MIDRYARPALQRLWSIGHQYESWLDVELAVCAAMESAGMVPEGVAARVRATTTLDPARVLELEAVVKHDVIAFLQHVEEQSGDDARWLHLGMTSSDVLDSSLGLRMVEAMELILTGVDRIQVALATLARQHVHTAMIGRSHGIHAEPISLGQVFALWYDEFSRNRVRLETAKDTIAVGKASGAVGTYAGLPPEIEAKAMATLGLRPAPVTNQVVQRDRHAEYLNALAVTGGTIEKVAVTIRHWQRTEVREAAEPFGKGQRGSSAMPHKRNPILTENLTGLARLLRAHASAALENIALWHERDISHSSVERVIVPDATTTLDFMLHRLAGVLEGLDVSPERMMDNVNLTGGLVYSQAILLALVRSGVPRSEAYQRVQRNAMAAWQEGGSYLERLLADAEVVGPLGEETLRGCFDVSTHLRHAQTIIDRVVPKEKTD